MNLNTLTIFEIIIVWFSIGANGVDFQLTLGHIKSKAPAETQRLAVIDLIRRIIPARAEEFEVIIEPAIASFGKDAFTLTETAEDGKIKIIGSTGVAAAWGFNHYLKHSCKAHISWETQQLNLPSPLPKVNLTIHANDRFRYYQNVCTVGYTFAWWSWADWEKHIDWMAMNGFNLVLSFHGQEAIWQRVYRKLNMTEQEIDEHFGGPAFLPWSRMGNIRGWGGPLTKSWHKRSLTIQRKSLDRMRRLGIITVLPAFAGHVPVAFKRLFPAAQMRVMDPWASFKEKYTSPYLLEPLDPLFQKIGNMFMQEQIKEYGTDHVYNCDPFNEMNPSSTDPTYLGQISRSIFWAMQETDPKAIWMLQGWLFSYASYYWTESLVKAFVTAVPMGRMIILDLYSDVYPQYTRLQSYFGQPYIWCMLHNFGGTLGMFGSAEIINTRPIEARNMPDNTMVGTGLTPEGINQNYVIYDLMIEHGWRRTPTNLSSWFDDYATRRYGKNNINATNAWMIFKNTVYNMDNRHYTGRCVLIKSPRLGIRPWSWYNQTEFVIGWEKLLDAAEDLKHNDGYRHDVVDTTRQVLQILADVYYTDLIMAFRNKNAYELQNLVTLFNDLFADLESILASNKAFLLGNWIEAAKAAANNSEERALYEFNARNQITLWGPRGEIKNYAGKQWSGLVSHYFAKRWSLFMSEMYDSVVNNVKFDQKEVGLRIFLEIELPFTRATNKFSTKAKGDSISIAKKIHKKWRSKVKPRARYLRQHHNAKDLILAKTEEFLLNDPDP